MIKRILYSQNENVIKDDYFVIDGVLEQDNVSNLSLDAFQIIKDTEDWKETYKEEGLVIRRKGNYLNIKSHYINKDESGRFIFYVYYVESKDINEMLEYLKSDSAIINKEIGFKVEKLIQKIDNKKIIKKTIIGILISIIITYIIWNITE
jgi:hypothetical protein